MDTKKSAGEPSSPAACSALPCESCKHMDWTRMYCHFLRHPIANGYAMRCHAMSCGGYMPNEKLTGGKDRQKETHE